MNIRQILSGSRSGDGMKIPTIFCVLSMMFMGQVAADDVLIRGAKVHTLTGAEPQEVSVRVRGGLIAVVGPDLRPLEGEEVVDARGLVMTPGLIESASQIGLVEISATRATDDTSVDDYPLGPAMRVADAINSQSTLIAVNRLGGVTRSVVFPDAGYLPIAGQGALIHLGTGWDLVMKESLGMVVQFGSYGARLTGGSRAAAMVHLREAFAHAKRFHPRRYRSDPHTGGYGAPDLAALQRYLRSNEPLVVGVDRAQDILAVLRLAGENNRRLVIVGGAEAWKVAAELASAGVAVVLDPLDNIPGSFDILGARMDNAALLMRAGVKVAYTARNTHNVRRLRFLAGNTVAHGVDWMDALAAITSNPASIWGVDKQLGSIEPGKIADLVLWDGDPLELTTLAQKVMINGEWMPLTSRSLRLAERYKDLKVNKPFAYR